MRSRRSTSRCGSAPARPRATLATRSGSTSPRRATAMGAIAELEAGLAIAARGRQRRRHRPRPRQPQRGAQLLRPGRAGRRGRSTRDRAPPTRIGIRPRTARTSATTGSRSNFELGRLGPRGALAAESADILPIGTVTAEPLPDQPLGAAARRAAAIRRRRRPSSTRLARADRRRARRGPVQRQLLRGDGRARAVGGSAGRRARRRGARAGAPRRPRLALVQHPPVPDRRVGGGRHRRGRPRASRPGRRPRPPSRRGEALRAERERQLAVTLDVEQGPQAEVTMAERATRRAPRTRASTASVDPAAWARRPGTLGGRRAAVPARRTRLARGPGAARRRGPGRGRARRFATPTRSRRRLGAQPLAEAIASLARRARIELPDPATDRSGSPAAAPAPRPRPTRSA